MKVLVAIPDFGRYGGTSRFLERLLDIHTQSGIVTVLLVPLGRCHPVLNSLAAQFGVELIQSPNCVATDTASFLTPFYDFLFSWRTVLTLRPDLIVVSTGEPGRFSILLYFPIPVLYILHSVPEQRFRLLPRLYLWVGAMLNNCITTVSNASAKSLSDLMGIPRNRIEVVYNSCGGSDSVCRKDSDSLIVLTAGHMVTYKNPELWLEVARKVLLEYPDALFVWLGDGELLETIRKKVKELSLEEFILLPGYVSAPSIWYSQADIYFQPSLRESHGIAVLEAMSYALPCVVSDVGGLPESVVAGETGFICPPADSSGFAERIKELLGDAALCEQFGAAGRQRVEEYFSEEIQEKKIKSLYDCLLNKRGKQ